jgi:hypothetical protein
VRTLCRCLPLLSVLALTALPPAAFAHRLDEYLQATLVEIEPDTIRLHVNLTPGVAAADVVLAMIDRDHDGTISPDEAAAYTELLRRDLTVRLDGREVELTLKGSTFPTCAEVRKGSGTIQTGFAARVGDLPARPHQLIVENRHLPAVGVYLVNAARPTSPLVRVTAQTRNDNQSNGEIEFTTGATVRPTRAAPFVASLAALLSVLSAVVWRARKRVSVQTDTATPGL